MSLPWPHQLMLMAPAPVAAIHSACCSMTVASCESYGPSRGMLVLAMSYGGVCPPWFQCSHGLTPYHG